MHSYNYAFFMHSYNLCGILYINQFCFVALEAIRHSALRCTIYRAMHLYPTLYHAGVRTLTTYIAGHLCRKDTHDYHEQLHIVPFTVLARLTTPADSAGAGGEGEEGGDGSMEVDGQYIPVSPALAQATRDRTLQVRG